MPTNPEIDTAKVAGRRNLQFETIDEILADLDRLEAANRQGRLRVLGNWTPGQNLGHLAAWIDYSYDGAPFKVPFFIRLMLRPMKKRFLYKPMDAGRRIPKLPGGTVGFDVLPFDEGLVRLRRNLKRLQAAPPQRQHMLFGSLTHEQWVCQHLRHAELHLSFLCVD